MQAPVVAMFKDWRGADESEPIRCAAVPTSAQRHKHELLRYLVLLAAFLAVVLLIAIALYYTQGNSVHIQHISALALEQPASCLRI